MRVEWEGDSIIWERLADQALADQQKSCGTNSAKGHQRNANAAKLGISGTENNCWSLMQRLLLRRWTARLFTTDFLQKFDNVRAE